MINITPYGEKTPGLQVGSIFISNDETVKFSCSKNPVALQILASKISYFEVLEYCIFWPPQHFCSNRGPQILQKIQTRMKYRSCFGHVKNCLVFLRSVVFPTVGFSFNNFFIPFCDKVHVVLGGNDIWEAQYRSDEKMVTKPSSQNWICRTL